MLKSTTDAISLNPPITIGDLNYVLTRTCQAYLKKQVILNYQAYNDVIGAIECCKLEMYRRLVAPYEEEKIAENGDVKL
jgi:hypothetical protein